MTERDGRRVALITGAAVGIGRSIAETFAENGYDIALTYHSHSGDEVSAEVRRAGAASVAMQVDATDPAQVTDAVAATLLELGRIDVVITNAGGLVSRQGVGEMSTEHWHTVIDVNLSSTFYFVREAQAHLPKGGRIITMSSLAGENGGGEGGSAYAASKAGVIGLTRALAKELGPRGITVNTLAPGFIDKTPFHATFSTEEGKKAMAAGAAVRRPGVPADVAAAALFLASEQASFITGAVIDLNGGAYFS